MGNLSKDYSLTTHIVENTCRIVGTGRLIGQAVQDIFQIADQHRQANDGRFIVDLTNAILVANVWDIEQHMFWASQANLCADCHLAVIYAPWDHLQTTRFKFLESLSKLQTARLRVFTEEHEALNWLRTGSTANGTVGDTVEG